MALSNDKEFRPLRRATADRGGSDELLKKLEQNFQTDNARQLDKSKFENQKGAMSAPFLVLFINFFDNGKGLFLALLGKHAEPFL